MKKLKKRILQYIQINILPFFLQLYIRFVYLTSKKRFHHPSKLDNEAFIVCLWHGNSLLQPLNYRKFKKNGTVKAIISEHRDGETIKNLFNYLGVGAIKGSSTRGGVRALVGAIKAIKNGIDVAITPDGPQGPIYSIADGIVLLAQKTKCKVLCFSAISTKYWRINTWDKFTIPKPFSTIDFYISEPITLDGLSMDEAKEKIKSNMRYFDE